MQFQTSLEFLNIWQILFEYFAGVTKANEKH